MFGNKKRKSYFNLQSPIDVLSNKVSEIGERITTNPLDRIMSGDIKGVQLDDDLTNLRNFMGKSGKFNNSMFGQVLGIDDVTRQKMLQDQAKKMVTSKRLSNLMQDVNNQRLNTEGGQTAGIFGRTNNLIEPFEYARPINPDGGSYTDMLPSENIAGAPLVVASEANQENQVEETDEDFMKRMSGIRNQNEIEQKDMQSQVDANAQGKNGLLDGVGAIMDAPQQIKVGMDDEKKKMLMKLFGF